MNRDQIINAILKRKSSMALFAIFMIFSLTVSLGRSSTLGSSANIRVLELFSDPQQVQAGKTVTLTLKIDNYATETANNLKITAKPTTPFSLVDPSAATQTIGNLGGLREAYVEYEFSVSADAVENTYELEFTTTTDDSESTKSHKIEVDVEANPNLILSKIDFPSTVSADSVQEVTLTFKNAGTGNAEDVSVELSTTPQGSTDNSLFRVVGTGNVVLLGDFNPEETKSATFTLEISQSASGLYELPLTLSYDGTSINYELKIDVDATVDLVLSSVILPKKVLANADNIITLNLTNFGGMNAKNVFVTVNTVPDGSTDSSLFSIKGQGNKISVGTIKAATSVTSSFTLHASEKTSGIYSLPLTLAYGSQTKELKLKLIVEGTPEVLLSGTSLPEAIGQNTPIPVELSFTNVGDRDATNVFVEVSTVPEGSTDTSLFTVVEGRSKFFVDSLEVDQSKKVSFSLMASEKTSGIYSLPVTVTYGKETVTTKTYELKLNIDAVPDLVVTDVELTPVQVGPGGIASINVKMKNDGNLAAEDVSIILNTIPVGTTGTTTPFALTDGKSEKSFKRIDIGQEVSATYQVLVDPDAQGVYTLKAYVSYKGLSTPIEGIVSLPVFGTPRLDAAVRGVSEDAGLVTLSVDVMNGGSASANAIVVVLEDVPGMKLVSSPRSLLGSLEPNEIQTVDFTMRSAASQMTSVTEGRTKKQVATGDIKTGPIKAKVTLLYKDQYNNDQSLDSSLEFSTDNEGSSAYARRNANGTSSGGTTTYVMYVLSLIGAIVVLKAAYGKFMGKK